MDKEFKFKFELGQNVTITASGEQGVVIGRAEYMHCQNNNLIRYKAADGRATEVWWTDSALS